MDWLNKIQLESAIEQIKEGFETVRQIAGAYGMDYCMVRDRIKFHVDEGQFEEICRAFNRIPCLEIEKDCEKYPYRKHILVNGVEFFMLADKIEELKEAV